jgi:2-polyprenyl-6-methoxyphenol hydroxylase-like FAD-dependent oxidoreductase
MAALLAARVLSEQFARVTLVERDALAVGAVSRKGVPQGNHAHGLLASGYRVLDEYFPGLMDELEAAGAPRGDIVGEFLWYLHGGWKLRHDAGLRGMTVSRPALESAVRERVRALARVGVLDRRSVERPLLERGRVIGVVLADGEALTADLVVDATGRGSRSPRWLEEWGYGRPETKSVRVDVGYATRVFERRPGDLHNSMGGFFAGSSPAETRFGAVLAVEGRRWVVTLEGMLGDYPPTDDDAWLEWSRSLPTDDVYELARGRRSLGPVVSYRFRADQRRRFERMKRFPEGYLVVGDAVCSFHPVYGQGMSVAAMEAKALGESLAAGDRDLARRFFRACSRIVDTPWLLATGEDLRYPQIEGKRPPLAGLLNRYLERVHHVATFDAEVCRRFFHVTNLRAPPSSLLTPATMRRVLLARKPAPSTAHTTPAPLHQPD